MKLRQGEKVGVIVVRHPDPARWDLKRLAQAASEDEALAASGLDALADGLEAQDRRCRHSCPETWDDVLGELQASQP